MENGKTEKEIKDNKKAGLLEFVSVNKTAADLGICCFGLHGCKTHFKMSLIMVHACKKPEGKCIKIRENTSHWRL